MASVDPRAITPIETAGICFHVRELKISGRKAIMATLESFGKHNTLIAMFDSLADCAEKYIAGWDRPESFSKDAMEEVLDVKDLIALLQSIALNGLVSVDDKKKSEQQRSSNVANFVPDALAIIAEAPLEMNR